MILSGPANDPPPVHTQLLALYVDGPPDSASVYCTPAVTVLLVTAAVFAVPEKDPLDPVAPSVHAPAAAVPPLSLTTLFTSVSSGWRLFV